MLKNCAIIYGLSVATGVILAYAIQGEKGGYRQPSTMDRIVIYGADWCPWCRRAKTMVQALRTEGKATWQFRDIDTNEGYRLKYEELAAKHKQEGIPLILVNDQYLKGGFTALAEKYGKDWE